MLVKQPSISNYRYAFADAPPEEVLALLGEIPGRWGRMPPLSRALVVETGKVLATAGLLVGGRCLHERDINVGLIGVTGTGSLSADLDFAATLDDGLHFASPALFGYTLPNIALSEAANHYGLIGPVYAVFSDCQTPMAAAIGESERWLACRPELDLMLAGAFDSQLGVGDEAVCLSINLTVVSR